MYAIKGLEPRDYQKNIADTASRDNTLVVLPTGMGKTLIAVLVAVKRLNQHPDSKILILSPTRPLSAQHKKSLGEYTSIDPEEIILLTGKVSPENRIELYEKAKVVIATPQTVENDLKKNRINLRNFSFVVFDEAHRAVKEYSYPYVAKRYLLQATNPLILGLTASPGATRERINDICNNLRIKNVEIRTEIDTDVEKYVQPIQRDFVYVDFPEEFKKIKSLLENVLKDDLYWLKDHQFLPSYRPPRKLLLDLQRRIMAKFSGGRNYSLFWTMVRTVSAVKLEYAIELLETQGVNFLYDYLSKLEKSKKKTDQRIMKDERMIEALKMAKELNAKKVNHPKLEKLIEVVKNLLRENSKLKIIVFANYRATVDKICEMLCEQNIKTEILIGQAIKNGKGLTQEKQIDVLKRFANGEFNVLVTSSIGEEGLDIAETNYAIFYEPVASEIRTIQRRGRVGRQIIGSVIFLITKDTRDEAYYYSAMNKEKKMKKILYKMKEDGVDRKENLLDWT
jgi:ERCC4-related helicase